MVTMNSQIPTFSSKKPTNTMPNSRIPSISTSSLSRGSSFSTNQKTLTGIKRPSNDPFFHSSSSKFKRSTPLSLIRSKSNQSQDNFVQPQVRLDFSQDVFQTPSSTISKNSSTFFSSVSRIPTIKKTNVPVIKDSTNENTILPEPKEVESKATSPIVDWKTITKESEIISYKVKINSLQKENQDLQSKNSKLRIDSQVNETKLRNEIDESQNKIKELTSEIKNLKKNEEKLKYEFEEFQKFNLEQAKTIEKQKIEYEKEISKLKDELFKVRSSEEECRSKSSMDLLNFEYQIKCLQSELEQIKQENQIHLKNSYDFQQKKQEVLAVRNELSEAKKMIDDLKSQLKSYQEGSKLESILQGELSQLKSIKVENELLKNKLERLSKVHEENMILKEKILGQENAIQLLNEKLDQKNIDMNDLEASKQKLNQWIKIFGFDCPEVVSDKIKKLNENVSLLTVENDILKSEIKNLKEKMANDEYSYKSNQSNLEKANEKIKSLSSLLEQANKKCSFLIKERDFYKNTNTTNVEGDDSNKTQEKNNSRVNELESLIEDYKKIVTKLESDLQMTREELDQIKFDKAENEELKNEIQRIKELNPHICTNASMLDMSTLQTNEKDFRIIHLKENPLAIEIQKSLDEFKNLKKENQRLKCLVEILERDDANKADITRQIDEAIQHHYEVEKLKNDKARVKKQFEDMKKIFKRECDSLRRACLNLTGYQIDSISRNKYRLRHKYSFKNEFMVEIDGDSIRLLENNTEKLQDMIKFYLIDHGSYPAFFAAYTLDLFNKRASL